jgi:aspartyl/asparaginyl beta-hydroxylase (cupin superfamily)
VRRSFSTRRSFTGPKDRPENHHDVERPLTSRIMATINHWYEATVIRASQTENMAGDHVGV